MPRIPHSQIEHDFLEYRYLVPRNGPPPKDIPITDYQFILGYTFLIATAIVEVIAILVFFARVYTRALPAWRFTLDDYIISIAFALMTVMFGLQYRTQTWTFSGKNPGTRAIDDVAYTTKIGLISLPFWAWATGLVKISIACMLLRFQQSPKWRIPIYLIITLNVLLIGFMGIAKLFSCIPFAALWDFKGKYPNKKCWSPAMSIASLWVSCLCNVISDVVLSAMPLTFLGKIRRPLKEKLVVGGLMGLGVLASTFSLCRLIVTCKKGHKDPRASIILTGLLACLEVQTSLIAACIPTLRSSSKRVLTRIGILRTETPDSNVHRYGSGSSVSEGRKWVRGRVELDAMGIEGRSHSSGIASPRETGQYIMDPKTGRIIHVTDLKEHTSSDHLNDEWKGELRRVIENGWEAQRLDSIGVAR